MSKIIIIYFINLFIRIWNLIYDYINRPDEQTKRRGREYIEKNYILKSDKTTPLWKHNCGYCKFICRMNNEDLYWCRWDKMYARKFGNHDHECGYSRHLEPEGSIYYFARRVLEAGYPPGQYESRVKSERPGM